jgi:hypothetical protein
MDATNLHITEYRGNQEIDFFGITSFKVQNHGEAIVEINTIPIYPGKTVKIIEEDNTQCDFKMIAKFNEEGKLPKFRAIYKQFGNADCYDHLHQPEAYKVTLYGYELGDIIDFSQNIAGHTFMTRSFDGGITFPPENDIDLGFIEANNIIGYNLGGSLETNAIQFRNEDLAENSEIFIVGAVVEPPFTVITNLEINSGPTLFAPNVSGTIILLSLPPENQDVFVSPDAVWVENSLGFSEADVNKAMDPNLIQSYWHYFKFRLLETGQETEVLAWYDPK